MKRIFVIISVVLILGLCSCSGEKEFTSPDYPIIDYPDETREKTIDGYRNTEELNTENSTVEYYYANKNSKKFHHSYCIYANKIGETSLLLEKERNNLINKGYVPCNVCNP